MSETIKSYRIRTNVGQDNYVSVNLEQDYDAFDILSLTINTHDVYRLHNANYGVVVGRVLANNGFGIPNAKISIFIEADENQRAELAEIYSYVTTSSHGKNGVRYNLLPDNEVGDCHQVVGTFPNKRYVLDNEDIIEVFDKYFKYTTRTNNSGDYIICGVPVGSQTLHMDLDLSDCGILSQRPRDFVYKGYTIEQFENPNMFKTGTTLSNLSQIFSQDQTVNVQPFWGNESLGETIGITRADIDVAFKFEPTCVFMGCAVSDNSSNGITKQCMGTPHMGDMDELTTGEGTIEMIRKTYAGNVEEFQIKGTELINGDGIWCYQIPMNLDYMITDEFGNMVPTDNPDKGIPTRARVRFRMSLHDMESNVDNFFRPKVLVPHNPQNTGLGTTHEDYDYDFGTNTNDESFRDLFWNHVYSVKSYIPRFQKRKIWGWRDDRFTGIKGCQYYGKNNPMPYNNIRIKLPFMFIVMCILIKVFIKLVGLFNSVVYKIGNGLVEISRFNIRGDTSDAGWIAINVATFGLAALLDTLFCNIFSKFYDMATDMKFTVIENGLCPDLDNWYFAPVNGGYYNYSPGRPSCNPNGAQYDLLKQTMDSIDKDDDQYSIDDINDESQLGNEGTKCITVKTDYLISCIEMNLAQEYRVINFDFYNDWINGMIYIPRFMRYIRKKRTFLGITVLREKVKGCMDDPSIFSKSRRYTQQCALEYTAQRVGRQNIYTRPTGTPIKTASPSDIVRGNNLHKRGGFGQTTIFGNNGGAVHSHKTIRDQYVYYLKPCEWKNNGKTAAAKINLFATDIILLGSLNDCDESGVPQAFLHLKGSTYEMPTNLALTNMEENGPLYTTEDGTLCSSKSNSADGTATFHTNSGTLLTVVTPNNDNSAPLGAELNIYERAGETIGYNDPSDTIALTEAAGIAWNYTGPQQGSIDESKFYYPGGHFLGLSCINSQTNVKSCLNLERICEIGTTMSQRHDEVSSIENNKLTHTYIVPTGFISGDEIIDSDFRTMFATMNKVRLIATKINPETGYKMYDFESMTPVNFGGELNSFTTGDPYNKTISTSDENLSKYGIARSSTRPDYDERETSDTKTRTIESPSLEYYLFRMGLNFKDLSNNSNSRHLSKFGAISGNGNRFMPQYENSYYFYFGLRDGATALDEFNKQFFAACENKTVANSEPSVEATVGDYSPCGRESQVDINIYNMLPPYIVDIDGETVITGTSYISKFFPYGGHSVSVTDSDNNEASVSFYVGEDFATYVINQTDFNITPKTGFHNKIDWDETEKNEFVGGYAQWVDVFLRGFNNDGTNIRIVIKDRPGASTGEPILDGTTLLVSRVGMTDLYYALYYQKNLRWRIQIKCDGVWKDSGVDGSLYFGGAGGELIIGPVEPITFKSLYSKLGINYTGGTTINWYDNSTIKNRLTAATNDEKNSSDFWAWNVRKSIVAPGVPGKDAFDTYARAKNGEKIVWMNPQRPSNANATIFCSDQTYDVIPNGYSVDDEYVYWGTDAGNRKKLYGTSYSGDIITDYYFGKIDNEPGTPLVIDISHESGVVKTYIPNSNNAFASGGCMFKAVPNGKLIPGRFYGPKNDRKIFLWGDEQELMSYENGLVYATHEHPALFRPFKTDVKYLIIHSISNYGPDAYSGCSYTQMNVSVSGSVSIQNGVRFNNHYCGFSNVDCLPNYARLTGLYRYLPAFIIENNEVFDENTEVKKYDGTNNELYVPQNNQTISYSIKEGCPLVLNTFKNLITFEIIKEYDSVIPFRTVAPRIIIDSTAIPKQNDYLNAAEERQLDMGWTVYDDIYVLKWDNSIYVITGNSFTDMNYALYNTAGNMKYAYEVAVPNFKIMTAPCYVTGDTIDFKMGNQFIVGFRAQDTSVAYKKKISSFTSGTTVGDSSMSFEFEVEVYDAPMYFNDYRFTKIVLDKFNDVNEWNMRAAKKWTGSSDFENFDDWYNQALFKKPQNILITGINSNGDFVPVGYKIFDKNDKGLEKGSIYYLSESPKIFESIPYGPPVLTVNGQRDAKSITIGSSPTNFTIIVSFKLSSSSMNQFSLSSNKEWVTFSSNSTSIGEVFYSDVVIEESKKKSVYCHIAQNETGSERTATVTIRWGENNENNYSFTIKQNPNV